MREPGKTNWEEQIAEAKTPELKELYEKAQQDEFTANLLKAIHTGMVQAREQVEQDELNAPIYIGREEYHTLHDHKGRLVCEGASRNLTPLPDVVDQTPSGPAYRGLSSLAQPQFKRPLCAKALDKRQNLVVHILLWHMMAIGMLLVTASLATNSSSLYYLLVIPLSVLLLALYHRPVSSTLHVQVGPSPSGRKVCCISHARFARSTKDGVLSKLPQALKPPGPLWYFSFPSVGIISGLTTPSLLRTPVLGVLLLLTLSGYGSYVWVLHRRYVKFLTSEDNEQPKKLGWFWPFT